MDERKIAHLEKLRDDIRDEIKKGYSKEITIQYN